ncbi:MAG: hypothetical protein SPL94_06200 [Oribacterium sp.]|nr:hypothetical protein [Oribacterium sp.]
MTETEKKKQWLQSYRWIGQRVRFLERQEERLRLSALPSGVSYDGMPHGSGDNTADLANYAAKVNDAHAKVTRIKTLWLERYDDVMTAIMKLPAKESEVLALRYIECLQWNECAHMMGYKDPRSIYPIHGSALEHLVMPTYDDEILYGGH